MIFGGIEANVALQGCMMPRVCGTALRYRFPLPRGLRVLQLLLQTPHHYPTSSVHAESLVQVFAGQQVTVPNTFEK